MVFKRLGDADQPSVKGWHNYKVCETTETVVGAVTGPAAAPRSLLLGRYDGRLQRTGRTTNLARTASSTFAGLLSPSGRGHPWTGWSFSAGWGTGGAIPHACTVPAWAQPTTVSTRPIAAKPLLERDHHDECDKPLYGGGTCTCDLIEQYEPPSERDDY
ncbi:hypothetical protein [Streptomyces sp. NPDC058335]|uniref:hypothetical protein n=1 Tax=Streptomyces sp. NPDC058335 TaxID=3346451 RepID=UPI0036650A36